MGDGTSRNVPKDDDKVRSLNERLSGIDQKLVFEI